MKRMALITSPKKIKRLKKRRLSLINNSSPKVSLSKVDRISYRLFYKTRNRRECSSPRLSKKTRDLLALQAGLKVVSIEIERLSIVPLKADGLEAAPQEEVEHDQGKLTTFSTSASIAVAFILVALFLHVLFVSKEDVKKYLE
jgi:hypothetical protein